MPQTLARNGLIAAGLMNIVGVMVFSRLFTNAAVTNADPVVMSTFGLVMIVVWGLAYLAAATVGTKLRWLAAVFALEKLVYVVMWVTWLFKNSIPSLYAVDAFAGIFYGIYGLNDLVSMLFFCWLVVSAVDIPSAH